MSEIYRYKENQPITWFNKFVSKSNQYCLYCGCYVGEGANVESNKEHLIGREFVPVGEFSGGKLFNFIFRSCERCNNEKSNIERHISSVSLYNSPVRSESQRYNLLACRKALNDFHPSKKGVLIKDSGDSINLNGGFGRARMSFELLSPPQVDIKHFKLLAFRHIQGLFSLITSKDPLSQEGTSLLAPEYFQIFGLYNYSDWGNPQLLEIMSRAVEVPCYANINTANGFFKAMMRKSDTHEDEWFWALEWNKSYRVVGSITQQGKTLTIFRDLPVLIWHDCGLQDGVKTRLREETPLKDEQDILFIASKLG